LKDNVPKSQDLLVYKIDLLGELLKLALSRCCLNCRGGLQSWQQRILFFERNNGLIQIGAKEFRCGH